MATDEKETVTTAPSAASEAPPSSAPFSAETAVIEALAKQLGLAQDVVGRIFSAGVEYAERAHKRRRVASDNAGNGAIASPEPQSDVPQNEFTFRHGVSLEELRVELAAFAKERDWDQFHSPRNLALALVGEVGELCECFQWKGEVPEGLPGWSEKDRTHVGQELADVLLYLVRLSHKCRVDLSQSALDKLALNAAKYPAALVRGSSKKYSEYKAAAREGPQSAP